MQIYVEGCTVGERGSQSKIIESVYAQNLLVCTVIYLEWIRSRVQFPTYFYNLKVDLVKKG